MGNTEQIWGIKRALWTGSLRIKWGGQGEPQWEGKMTLELKGTERVSHLEKEAFVQRP